MKKMFIITGILLSGFAFSNDKTDNPFIYPETTDQNDQEEMKAPGTPGDPAPVDMYIPVLILAAVGFTILYGRNKRVTE